MSYKWYLAYYCSILLICLPSLYFLSPVINSPNIGRIIWVVLLVKIVYELHRKKLELFKFNTFFLLFFIFFCVQSLSIITANNISGFLNIYKDIIFYSIFVFVSWYFIKNEKNFITVFYLLIFVGVVNLFLKFIIMFIPDLFSGFISSFIHPTYLETIQVNMSRGRIFLTDYDEILIPLLFFFLFNASKYHKKMLALIFMACITVFAFLSGFRTKAVMAFFSLVGSLFIYRWYIRRNIIYILIFILCVVSFFVIVPSNSLESVINRFSENTDLDAFSTGRVESWVKAYDIGLSSPLIGVGLGNYYDHLNTSKKYRISLFPDIERQRQIAIQDPHNIFLGIFSETGILGLLSILSLFVYFIYTDYKVIFLNNKQLQKGFILSFWTLFIFSLLNPSTTIVYQVLFWLLRIIIEKQKKYEKI